MTNNLPKQVRTILRIRSIGETPCGRHFLSGSKQGAVRWRSGPPCLFCRITNVIHLQAAVEPFFGGCQIPVDFRGWTPIDTLDAGPKPYKGDPPTRTFGRFMSEGR